MTLQDLLTTMKTLKEMSMMVEECSPEWNVLNSAMHQVRNQINLRMRLMGPGSLNPSKPELLN